MKAMVKGIKKNGEKFDYIVRRRTERGYNMTVRDLYVYSNEEQKFILFEEGFDKPCFKGNLEDCPTELIDRTVYQFQAIDFNTIEVVLL